MVGELPELLVARDLCIFIKNVTSLVSCVIRSTMCAYLLRCKLTLHNYVCYTAASSNKRSTNDKTNSAVVDKQVWP